MDRALSMGCSIFCMAFECFSSFLVWALWQQSGLTRVAHYLDDFLFVGPNGADLLRSFMALAKKLGVSLSHERACDRALQHFEKFRQEVGYGNQWPLPLDQLLHYCVTCKKKGLSIPIIKGPLSALAMMIGLKQSWLRLNPSKTGSVAR